MWAIRSHIEQAWKAGMAAVLAALLCAPEPLGAAELELPVPRVIIYPGDVIGDDQLVERAFVAHTVARASVYEARQALLGKVARRTLLPGQPIPVGGIRDPYVVTQGKTVLVVYESVGLTITTNATALQNGSVGDLVSLRNDDSGLVIKGTVASDGTVRLSAP
jgi:flagellar basal body P-ring formation protein FlgA